MKKSSLSAIDLSAWVTENREGLTGCRIQSVYSMGEVYLLKLRCQAADKTLVIRPGKYLYLSNLFEKELPGIKPVPPLNQFLKDEAIRDVQQLGMERVLKFAIGPTQSPLELYVEFFSSGQLVLVREGKIVFVMKRLQARDRTLEPGRPYALPPSRGVSLEEALGKFFEGPALATLAHNISFPSEGVREALKRCHLDEQQPLTPESQKEAVEAMKHLWDKTKLKNEIAGYLYAQGEELTFHPFEFSSDDELRREVLPNFNSALEKAFSDDLVPALKREAERMKKSLQEAEEAAAKHRQRAQELKEKVQLLANLAPSLSAALERIASIQKKSGWEAVPLGEVEGFHVVEKRPSEGSVVLAELPGLPIDVRRKIWDQISLLHQEASQEEEKAKSAEQKLEALRERLTAEEAKEKKALVEASMRANRKRQWYERYRWFFTSNGELVIAGKDADQNISIIRNVLRPNMWAFHAEVHGSPLGVVLEDADKVSEDSLKEGAQFVACYSRAWSEGQLSSEVSVFKSDQVSLTPPSGTFLSKGSFMIYGKKTQVDTPLELAIGIEEHEDWFRPISGPPSAIKRAASVYVTLKPGSLDRKEVLEKALKAISYKLRKKGSPLAEVLKASDLEPLLPNGKSDVLVEEDPRALTTGKPSC